MQQHGKKQMVRKLSLLLKCWVILWNPGKESWVRLGPDWGVLSTSEANIYSLISNKEDTLKFLSRSLIRWHLVSVVVEWQGKIRERKLGGRGALPFQGSVSGKMDTNPQAVPWNVKTLDVWYSPFLSGPGRSKELGRFLLIKRCFAGRRDYHRGFHDSSLLALMHLLLSFAWGERGFQLVPTFLKKGNSLCIVVE